jgi:hypothetical protein
MALNIDRQSNAGEIARALADMADTIGPALLGEPTFRSPREMRWGRRGSFSLRLSGAKRGLWYDHEAGEGGDLLDLTARERGVRLADAVRIAQREFLGDCTITSTRTVPPGLKVERVADEDAEARTRIALRLWEESGPITGTLAEHYLVEHRRLDVRRLHLTHALRWHRHILAVVALMTDAATGKAIGVHRTFLKTDGTKRDRKMLGRQGVIRLSPDDTVTTGLSLTEGIEDGLAVLLSDWVPVWAATSSGAIARLPVVTGIEALTIFADSDAPGMQAAETCADRWRAAGCDTRVVSPGGVRP